MARFAKLHDLVKMRDWHFYNAPEVDQHLEPPYDTVEPFQSDIIRRTWVQAKGRLTENPWTVHVVPPKNTPDQNILANNFETVLQRGNMLAAERLGLDMQSALGDGQWLHCFGVLHCQKATDIWPAFEMIEDEDDLDPEDLKERLEQNKHDKAMAGYPFYLEVIRPDMFSFIEDKSCENQIGLALVMRNVSLIEYFASLRDSDKIVLSINDVDNKIEVYEETEAPDRQDPSFTVHWGKMLQVAQIWTRNECYELAKLQGESGEAWQIVKSFKHCYGEPPFWIAYADRVNHPDPARAYLPFAEGQYRVKPFFDHDMTLGRSIAEQIALPFFWVKLTDGSFMTDAEGNRVVLSKNALAAQALPAGAELVKVEFEMNPAFLQFLEMTGKELEDSSPDTGHVDYGASTQPWLFSMAQDEENLTIKRAKVEQAKAIRGMLRMQARVMSLPASEGGIGQTVYVYAKTKNGRIDRTTAIGVDPEDIPTLEIEVDINPRSSAQTIAAIERMRTWLSDPNMPFTEEDLLQEGFQDPNPQETIEAWRGEQIYNEKILPGLVDQELAKRFGDQFIVAPGMQIVGYGGDQVDPNAVLKANGVTPVAPQAPTAKPGLPGALQAEAAVAPPMPPYQPPGQAPVQAPVQ